MEGTNEVRIVILGKVGAGKSSTANTIFGEKIFSVLTSSSAGARVSETHTKVVNQTNLTIMEMPTLLNPECPTEEQQNEAKESVKEAHAFLLIMIVGVYGRENAELVDEFKKLLGKEALKYAVICFTHGDDLNDGQTIEDYVSKNAELKKLVDKCGGRCHVIDNKYWNNQTDKYRNNTVQIEKLLNTVKRIKREKSESYYSPDSPQTPGSGKRKRLAFLPSSVSNLLKRNSETITSVTETHKTGTE